MSPPRLTTFLGNLPPAGWMILAGLGLLAVAVVIMSRLNRQALAAFLATLRRVFSPGSAVIILLALGSSIGVALQTVLKTEGAQYWLFSEAHYKVYRPLVLDWNRQHPDRLVQISQLHIYALERRMFSGFVAGTPVADLLAVERPLAARAFTGPLDKVGFVDLTDRLRDGGLLANFVPGSLMPWTSRGRIFGLPLDVHPVLLAYRSDLVEAAGIDVSQVETWEDYFRILRPLQRDFDGDGRPDRWLLSLWDTNTDWILMILDQAGGGLFDQANRPQLNSPRNAEVLARIVTWVAGPGRVCVDLDPYSGSGHRQRLEGVAIGTIMPDWMVGLWKIELPGLAGKVKLMPLPAWEPGGRRTSVWRGGTMLGITKAAAHPETAWAFARHLALSTGLAEDLYRRTNIVPPNRALWPLKVFDEPDAYCSNQPVGRMFLQQADDVPVRASSPFAMAAQGHLGNALVNLRAWADETGTYDLPALQREAQRLLDRAQRLLLRETGRNTFLPPAS